MCKVEPDYLRKKNEPASSISDAATVTHSATIIGKMVDISKVNDLITDALCSLQSHSSDERHNQYYVDCAINRLKEARREING